MHLSIPKFRRCEQRYRIHAFPPSSSQRPAGGRTWSGIMKSQKMRLLMKCIVPVVAVFWSFSVACLSAMAQNSSDSAEIENLKLIVDQQQKALERQQAQIRALQSALTEQKTMLVSLVQGATSSDRPNPHKT